MSIQSTYALTAAKAQDLLSSSTDLWARGVQVLVGLAPPLPEPDGLDPTAPVDWYFDTAAMVLEHRRRYAKYVVGTMASMRSAARDQTLAVVRTARAQAGSAADLMHERADATAAAAAIDLTDALLAEEAMPRGAFTA